MDPFKQPAQTIPQIHLCNPLIGHIASPDCWCEPRDISIVKNKFGIVICVVLHEDFVLKHREIQLEERAHGFPPELAWIDRVIDGKKDYPVDPLHDIRAIPRKEF
jgi:hypothetical protein